MGYKLFNASGSEIVQSDLQDKMEWCQKGENLELAFLNEFGNEFELILNPDKATNPTVPDFLYAPSNRLADLKTQNTPFFKSKKLFGIDPQFAVTFNKVDLERYQKLYPEILIYYSVSWLATSIHFDNGASVKVKPMSGIWGINLKNLLPLCKESNLHEYIQRKNDNKGNAKSSYVVDLRSKGFKELLLYGI